MKDKAVYCCEIRNKQKQEKEFFTNELPCFKNKVKRSGNVGVVNLSVAAV